MGGTLGFWTPVLRPSGGCESEDKLFPLLMGLSFLVCMVGTGPSESSPGTGPRVLALSLGGNRDPAWEEGASPGEGAGLCGGRSRGPANQERHARSLLRPEVLWLFVVAV